MRSLKNITDPSRSPHRPYRKHIKAQSSSRPVASPLESVDMSETLSLQNIRSSLIRQEDTIIFGFIERAQFSRNDAVYTSSDAIPVPGESRLELPVMRLIVPCMAQWPNGPCMHDPMYNAVPMSRLVYLLFR